jgi:glycolate oxidase iron-sulfur subunit
VLIDLYRPATVQKVFGAELPDYELLSDCIRCGRCLPVCPTYQQTTLETQSPRGRLNLLRAAEDGRLDLEEPGLEAHLYHCLDCRACNTVCPAGIPIGELIVQGRAAVERVRPRNWIVRFALNVILISPRRAEFFAAPIRWVQRLRLDRLGVLLLGWIPRLGPTLRDLIQMAPSMSKPLRPELTTRLSDYSTTRLSDYSTTRHSDHSTTRRVGFFLGCVMNVAYADASRASVQLMQRFGCEVATPKDQLCCGAPHDDQGLKDKARAFARRNIAAFERLGELDAVVADCAACSGFLKEYGQLLRDEPEWADRARRFSAKVRDVTEWLDEILPAQPKWRSKGAPIEGGAPQPAITYHEPCHLANLQGVRRQPRALLARLGVGDVRELPDSTRCCGSAGIYNLTHPAMSRQLLDRKMADVASTGAQVVVSANPGCLLQLAWGAKRRKSHIAVKHIAQVIWDEISKENSEHVERKT